MKRRSFLKRAAVASAATTCQFLPDYAVGKTEKNDKVNLAIIGCSHRGGGIGEEAMKSGMANCVALCDVVPSRANRFKSKYKDARYFDDFRNMFDTMSDKIDACTIGTPDHSHFPIAILAMSMGKHVFVEKPLAHTFEECELLKAAEKKYNVCCQMGNQGQSSSQRLQFKTWVEAGIIKNVRRIDAWMNGSRRWHPWGDVQGFPPGQSQPEGMNWDVWAGTAPKRPYSSKYDNGDWRGWHDYGTGAMGDWGAHILDSLHRFLQLGLPHEIRVEKLEGRNDFIYPMASTIVFEFAARGPGMPATTLNWYDGRENKPPCPPELDKERYDSLRGVGKFLFSDDLVFHGGRKGDHLRIIPHETMQEMRSRLPDIPEPDTSTHHMHNFLRAVRREDPRCNSPFEVAAPLTQLFTLGCIAQRLGGTLKLDTDEKEITNNARANQLLNPPPRKDWEAFYRL